jgi:hypothetical protein
MKSKNSSNFFSEPEKEKITALVKKAERETSGEIAVMVVDESDSYREAEFMGALLLSAFIAFVAAVSLHQITIWSYIPAVILFWFPALLFMRRFPRFKLALAGKNRVVELYVGGVHGAQVFRCRPRDAVSLATFSAGLVARRAPGPICRRDCRTTGPAFFERIICRPWFTALQSCYAAGTSLLRLLCRCVFKSQAGAQHI